jgi:thiaminase
MDQAYQDGDWAAFQAALVGAKALLAEAQTEHHISPPAQEHWCYRAWSGVLDAEVWFVHCQQERTRLIQQGISRGAIYTESEMRDLLELPQRPGPEMLKVLHRVKQVFDFTIVTDVDETA